jgi:amidase
MNLQIEEITIEEIILGQTEGRFTAEELVYAYMDRIARYDKAGPGINAVLELNPDAPAIAAGLDAARCSGAPLGPLHGVPLLLKDNINTADKLHTTAGSLALANSYAPADAFLVGRLRDAGAVILGKANMTEWANFMTEGMPNGFSSRGGQVRNPYGKDLDVGGSSSGSAAGTTANLCAVAVGTETSGSILNPAVNTMLVGIKPTVGLVSRSGIIPISHSQDTAGPLARTVADAAALLSAMSGVDDADPATAASRPHEDTDYRKALGQDISGVRIGVPRKAFWDRLNEAERNAAEAAVREISGMGAIVVDPADLPSAEEEWSIQVLLHEFKSGLNAYLASLGPAAPVRTLGEIVAFNQAHRKRALKYGQSILTQSERLTSGTLTESEYIQARLRDLRICRTEGINAAISAHNLEALFFPSYYGCSVAAGAGYPSITVPTGMVDSENGRKPFGMTFTGPAFSELLLIRCAHAFEQHLKARTSPVMD